jgi:folate-binding protein YgfZ
MHLRDSVSCGDPAFCISVPDQFGRYNFVMPDSLPQVLPNPLHDLHQQAQAEFQSYAELPIVSTFGEPQAEYAAIHKGAALIDQPFRGFMVLTGKDRHSFLNNLITNQVWDKEKKAGITAGQGVYAFFLNTKGRVIVDMNVLELGDRLLLEMDARHIESTRIAFEKFRFAEKVTLENAIGKRHELAIHGPSAAQVLGLTEPLLPMQSRAVCLFDIETIVWRDDPTGQAGYQIIVDIANAIPLWKKLLESFGQATGIGKCPLRPVGWAAFNAARIEAGRPFFGIDFDDSVLPAETGQLSRAVSFTKGCYLGQEVVARMHARNVVARQIIGIRMNDDSLPIAGSHIFAPDGSQNQIGGITSSTVSPILSNASICLGIVKKAYMAPGSIVEIPAEGAMRKGTVVALPFRQS